MLVWWRFCGLEAMVIDCWLSSLVVYYEREAMAITSVFFRSDPLVGIRFRVESSGIMHL